jgi:sulfate/thiosulfate transport system ATP-binding protein
VVLNNGRIEQIGSPEEVYDRPASAFVHDFIGEAISLPVEVRGREVWFDQRVLPLESQATPSGPARLFIRPFDMSLVAPNEGALTGIVKLVKGLGPHLRVEVECHQERGEPIALEIQTGRGARVEAGQTIGLRPERYRIFPQPDEQAGSNAVSPEKALPA